MPIDFSWYNFVHQYSSLYQKFRSLPKTIKRCNKSLIIIKTNGWAFRWLLPRWFIFLTINQYIDLTSKYIVLIHDSTSRNGFCIKELEKEDFVVSIKNSAEGAIKTKNKPELIILSLKLNSEGSRNLIEKFKGQNAPAILFLEWGKDKMSFPLWASDVKVVKAGDQNDLKWTIKETLR